MLLFIFAKVATWLIYILGLLFSLMLLGALRDVFSNSSSQPLRTRSGSITNSAFLDHDARMHSVADRLAEAANNSDRLDRSKPPGKMRNSDSQLDSDFSRHSDNGSPSNIKPDLNSNSAVFQSDVNELHKDRNHDRLGISASATARTKDRSLTHIGRSVVSNNDNGNSLNTDDRYEATISRRASSSTTSESSASHAHTYSPDLGDDKTTTSTSRWHTNESPLSETDSITKHSSTVYSPGRGSSIETRSLANVGLMNMYRNPGLDTVKTHGALGQPKESDADSTMLYRGEQNIDHEEFPELKSASTFIVRNPSEPNRLHNSSRASPDHIQSPRLASGHRGANEERASPSMFTGVSAHIENDHVHSVDGYDEINDRHDDNDDDNDVVEASILHGAKKRKMDLLYKVCAAFGIVLVCSLVLFFAFMLAYFQSHPNALRKFRNGSGVQDVLYTMDVSDVVTQLKVILAEESSGIDRPSKDLQSKSEDSGCWLFCGEISTNRDNQEVGPTKHSSGSKKVSIHGPIDSKKRTSVKVKEGFLDKWFSSHTKKDEKTVFVPTKNVFSEASSKTTPILATAKDFWVAANTYFKKCYILWKSGLMYIRNEASLSFGLAKSKLRLLVAEISQSLHFKIENAISFLSARMPLAISNTLNQILHDTGAVSIVLFCLVSVIAMAVYASRKCPKSAGDERPQVSPPDQAKALENRDSVKSPIENVELTNEGQVDAELMEREIESSLPTQDNSPLFVPNESLLATGMHDDIHGSFDSLSGENVKHSGTERKEDMCTSPSQRKNVYSAFRTVRDHMKTPEERKTFSRMLLVHMEKDDIKEWTSDGLRLLAMLEPPLNDKLSPNRRHKPLSNQNDDEKIPVSYSAEEEVYAAIACEEGTAYKYGSGGAGILVDDILDRVLRGSGEFSLENELHVADHLNFPAVDSPTNGTSQSIDASDARSIPFVLPKSASVPSRGINSSNGEVQQRFDQDQDQVMSSRTRNKSNASDGIIDESISTNASSGLHSKSDFIRNNITADKNAGFDANDISSSPKPERQKSGDREITSTGMKDRKSRKDLWVVVPPDESHDMIHKAETSGRQDAVGSNQLDQGVRRDRTESSSPKSQSQTDHPNSADQRKVRLTNYSFRFPSPDDKQERSVNALTLSPFGTPGKHRRFSSRSNISIDKKVSPVGSLSTGPKTTTAFESAKKRRENATQSRLQELPGNQPAMDSSDRGVKVDEFDKEHADAHGFETPSSSRFRDGDEHGATFPLGTPGIAPVTKRKSGPNLSASLDPPSEENLSENRAITSSSFPDEKRDRTLQSHPSKGSYKSERSNYQSTSRKTGRGDTESGFLEEDDTFRGIRNAHQNLGRGSDSPDPHGFAREAAGIFDDDPFFNDDKEFKDDRFGGEQSSWSGSMSRLRHKNSRENLRASDGW